MRRFWIFLLILLLASGYKDLYAQPETQRLADSLLRELSKRKDDTNKVKLLNDISFTYRYINTDEGIKYGQQSLELAAKLGWKPGTARALQRLATNYTVKSDYPKALEYSFKALKIWEETGDKSAIGEIS